MTAKQGESRTGVSGQGGRKSGARRSGQTKQAQGGGSGTLIALGAAGMAAGVALVGYLLRRGSGPTGAEHTAPDLALDQPHPDAHHRAPEAFRPDPTAPVPDSEREALRPATGPAPSLVRGSVGDRDKAEGMTIGQGTQA